MLDLGPTKLLVIFIVVVVLLGPDKLPQVARQLGSGWRRLRQLQAKMESDLRESVPDLPSTQEIAQFARSPMSLLSRLSDMTDDDLVEDPAADGPVATDGSWPEDPTMAGEAPDESELALAPDRAAPSVPGAEEPAGTAERPEGADGAYTNGHGPGDGHQDLTPAGLPGLSAVSTAAAIELPDDPSMN